MLAIVDGNYLTHRVRHIKELQRMTNSTGIPTGVVLGWLRSLHGLLVKFPTISSVVVVFDGGKSARRRELFPDYKKKPKSIDPQDQQLFEDAFLQQDIIQNSFLWRLGMRSLRFNGVEGDDLIGWILQMTDPLARRMVVSDDKDMIQFVDLETMVYRPVKDEVIHREQFEQFTGFDSIQRYMLYRAIVGDASDCIPGVNGAGDKTAREALNSVAFETLDQFRDSCTRMKSARIKKIAEQWDIVLRNIELMDVSQEELPDETRGAIQKTLNAPCQLWESGLPDMLKSLGMKSIHEQYGTWVTAFNNLR